MSKAAELAALIGSQTALSHRNRVINGEFQIWQRGTSQTSAGYGSADRWRLNVSGATLTGSQGTFTDGQTAVPGNPKFYLALDVTTGNDNAGWFHRLEGTHEFANDVYTLSFWAKSATPRAMTVGANSYDSSEDTFDETHTVSPSTFTPTSSWQKFTFKVTFSNMSTLGSFASGDFTAFFITQGSDTSTAAWKLDLALVQFEKGEQATPFEHRSLGDELLRCQRYYYRVGDDNNGGGYHRYAVGSCQGTSSCGITVHAPVKMRTTPTLEQTGTASNYALYEADSVHACSSVPAINSAHCSPSNFNVTFTSSGNLASGNAAEAINNNNTTSYLAFAAEL